MPGRVGGDVVDGEGEVELVLVLLRSIDGIVVLLALSAGPGCIVLLRSDVGKGVVVPEFLARQWSSRSRSEHTWTSSSQ